MTKSRIAVAALACLAVLVLAGCIAIPFGVAGGHDRGVPVYGNGQVLDVVGMVSVDRNEISLQDQNSNAVFRFVGLQPAQRKALVGLDGKYTRVRLRVVGAARGNTYNAQLVQFSGRP